ncbi:MAG: hypothetical protein HYX92_06765 [Chloroflexi bacterium]|nr:hypothetical protein [Chloroflexota bacterium]
MYVKRWLPVVACLAALAVVLASCTAGVATPGPTPPTSRKAPAPEAKSPAVPSVPAATPKPVAGQPRYGGILTISTLGDPVSLDMHQETSYLVANVVQLAYNGITQYNPESSEEVIGDLARNWETSKDGLTYTFHLSENLKFHDGGPFAAEDARFSFERMVRPPRDIRAPRRPQLAAVDKVEAPDKGTLKFTLKYPSASFLNVLSSGFMVVFSKAFVEKKSHMKNDVLGTGPYKLKTYSAGVSLEYVKNADYFVKGRPYVDGITFYIIRDPGTRLAAFRTGQVKLTGPGEAGLTPAAAQIVRRTLPQEMVVPYPSMCNNLFLMNALEKPWTDLRVRTAAHLAIDRQKGIEVLGQGFGEIGSNMLGKWGIAKEELAKMPGWRQPKDADIAEAKRLLTEAGYPDGFTVKTLVRAEKNFEDMSVYMADQLAKIGVKLELDVKESAVRGALLNQGAFSNHPMLNCFNFPDPEDAARLWAAPTSGDWGQNWARYADDKITELLAKQSRALDPAERMKIVRELDLKMIEVAVRPGIYWSQALIGIWPEVKNRGKLIGNYSLQKYQDIWLAK